MKGGALQAPHRTQAMSKDDNDGDPREQSPGEQAPRTARAKGPLSGFFTARSRAEVIAALQEELEQVSRQVAMQDAIKEELLQLRVILCEAMDLARQGASAQEVLLHIEQSLVAPSSSGEGDQG